MAGETLKNVILNEREDYPKGESRAQASLGMTEPKGRGVAPSSNIFRLSFVTPVTLPGAVFFYKKSAIGNMSFSLMFFFI